MRKKTKIDFIYISGHLHGPTGSAVGHRSIAPGFKPRSDYVRRVFPLSLRFIILGGRSAHLKYLVHKNGSKISTVTFMYISG